MSDFTRLKTEREAYCDGLYHVTLGDAPRVSLKACDCVNVERPKLEKAEFTAPKASEPVRELPKAKAKAPKVDWLAQAKLYSEMEGYKPDLRNAQFEGREISWEHPLTAEEFERL